VRLATCQQVEDLSFALGECREWSGASTTTWSTTRFPLPFHIGLITRCAVPEHLASPIGPSLPRAARQGEATQLTLAENRPDPSFSAGGLCRAPRACHVGANSNPQSCGLR